MKIRGGYFYIKKNITNIFLVSLIVVSCGEKEIEYYEFELEENTYNYGSRNPYFFTFKNRSEM